ncbi:hypothetical protein DNTS_006095 [Danionella cerebrum]|uniref:Chemokine interleukin-8-like domain-containing protein n=1 Tax=Danionella cerebrum TaxID=2873325 RepID=A0A553QMF6_9TELE|nr:hypothetical protein DNTS_006095 [Danionella translucida]
MHLPSTSQHQIIILSCLLLLLSAFTSGELSASETESVTVYGYDPKKPMCCKKLFDDEPKEKIINCYIFPETRKCLRSVVFIDVKMKKHCINPSASWLGEKIKLLEMQQNDGVKCEDYRKPTWPWTS